MTTPKLVFALAGMGDFPAWTYYVAFSLWPYHVTRALGITDRALTLAGYGPAAVICQAVMLAMVVLAAPLLFGSSRVRPWVKILFIPVAYPVVTLATNLIPGSL